MTRFQPFTFYVRDANGRLSTPIPVWAPPEHSDRVARLMLLILARQEATS